MARKQYYPPVVRLKVHQQKCTRAICPHCTRLNREVAESEQYQREYREKLKLLPHIEMSGYRITFAKPHENDRLCNHWTKNEKWKHPIPGTNKVCCNWCGCEFEPI